MPDGSLAAVSEVLRRVRDAEAELRDAVEAARAAATPCSGR
ncbi:hypothetical protein [Lentzea sp.]